MAFIDAHRDRFGVEPTCKAIQVAPSTYAAERRPPSARRRRDEALKAEVLRVWRESFDSVYGADKVWCQLNREGTRVARCTLERLMRELGISGVRRARPKRTTVPAEAAARPGDLVERRFAAPAPTGSG